MKYFVYQVDSFTSNLFEGNPAGVVLNAEGLSESRMQKIARELNNSETAFLLPPESDDHEVYLRFFTPTVEVPSCGHATVAAHYVRAVENKMKSCRVIQKIKAGILPVDVIESGGDYKIVMTQGKVEFEEPLSRQLSEAAAKAIGLDKDDLDNNCPVQIVSTGHSKVMIGIKSRRKLNLLKPDLGSLAKLSRQIKCNGYFVFTFDSDSEEILTYGRMFAPAIGISEDPVTGNANGPLGAYIVKHNLIKNDGKIFKFKGRQGVEIGRPGIVEVETAIENGNPVLVKVGGFAKIVFRTELDLI